MEFDTFGAKRAHGSVEMTFLAPHAHLNQIIQDIGLGIALVIFWGVRSLKVVTQTDIGS